MIYRWPLRRFVVRMNCTSCGSSRRFWTFGRLSPGTARAWSYLHKCRRTP